MAITDFLMKHADRNPVSFHMPGHKGNRLYEELGYSDFISRIPDCDITEIPGADNLFQTEGIIKEVMCNYKKLYEVKESYLLINGTSGGIIASMLASVSRGGKIIMARNCHKSVFNALILGDITPVYVYPELNKEFGISGRISAEEIAQLLDENEDAEAVILPSPNYYGICSDIKEIASEVHKRNKILIVDQAHGAHLKFFNEYENRSIEPGTDTNMPLCAETAGADIVINSTHKTLASFTQSAVLNVTSDRVKKFDIEDKLQAIESTSPSYILMASLDINANMLAKYAEELIGRWNENLKYFYKEAAKIKGLKVMYGENTVDIGEKNSGGFDRTKINISLENFGINGAELERILIEDYNIYTELFTGNLAMCMTGIGTTRSDIKRLLAALTEITAKAKFLKREMGKAKKEIPLQPQMAPEIYAVPSMRKLIPLTEAVGNICAGSIIPYPPGIPFLCPGEKINKDAVEYIEALRANGEKVIGVTERGEVMVGV